MKYLIATILLFPLISLASPQLSIENAWVSLPPPSAKVAAAYLKIVNTGSSEIKIKKISSPQFKDVQMHKTEVTDDGSKMVQIFTKSIPSNQSIEFLPGEDHLMLISPKKTVLIGDQISFVITTEDNQTIPFTATVSEGPKKEGTSESCH